MSKTKEITDQERLEQHCQHIVTELEKLYKGEILDKDNGSEPMSFYDWNEDCLDIKYVINSDKSYNACKILVAFGGPNIWINTDDGTVDGYWWGSVCHIPMPNEVIEMIDQSMEEIFSL